MKYLKINNNQGYFTVDEETWVQIDKIGKDDLLTLIQKIINDEATELDTYSEELIANPAQKIIYDNLYQRLNELASKRVQFHDETKELYKEAIEQYK